MFVAKTTQREIRDFLASPDTRAALEQNETQEALRDALRAARHLAEQRRLASEISPELISQRVSI
jgi:hypothetical protein